MKFMILHVKNSYVHENFITAYIFAKEQIHFVRMVCYDRSSLSSFGVELAKAVVCCTPVGKFVLFC